MDNGQWTVDSGQWTVDSGQWTVDSGQWTVDSGQWTVDSGHIKRVHPDPHIACTLKLYIDLQLNYLFNNTKIDLRHSGNEQYQRTPPPGVSQS